MLLSADDASGQTLTTEARVQCSLYLRDEFLAMAADIFYRSFNKRSAHRVQHEETQFLEFDPDIVHAEPVGDRCINIDGFFRDAAPFVEAQYFERAHVVQAIGEL